MQEFTVRFEVTRRYTQKNISIKKENSVVLKNTFY